MAIALASSDGSACQRSQSSCRPSQKSALMPVTRARRSAVSGVTDRLPRTTSFKRLADAYQAARREPVPARAPMRSARTHAKSCPNAAPAIRTKTFTKISCGIVIARYVFALPGGRQQTSALPNDHEPAGATPKLVGVLQSCPGRRRSRRRSNRRPDDRSNCPSPTTSNH